MLRADTLEALDWHSETLQTWRALSNIELRSPNLLGLVRCYERLAAVALQALTRRDAESSLLLRRPSRSRMPAAQCPGAPYFLGRAPERGPGVRAAHETVAEIYGRSGRSDWGAVELAQTALLPRIDCRSVQYPAFRFMKGKYIAIARNDSGASSASVFWAARANAKLAEQSLSALASKSESVDQIPPLADIPAPERQSSEAADEFRRALDLRQGDGSLQRQLAGHVWLARRGDEALPLLQRVTRSGSPDPQWPAMLGILPAEEQEFEEALPFREAALAPPGARSKARRDRGRFYLAMTTQTRRPSTRA